MISSEEWRYKSVNGVWSSFSPNRESTIGTTFVLTILRTMIQIARTRDDCDTEAGREHPVAEIASFEVTINASDRGGRPAGGMS
jgi:hypothetical protein